jgi:alkylation response protein AidB-like acyl-CoA dehydrogenase
MSPFSVNKRDIQFVLFEYLDVVNNLFSYKKYNEFDRDSIELVLDTLIKLATEKIAPLNVIMDRHGLGFKNNQVTTPPEYKDAYQAICKTGLFAPASNPDYGGGGLPNLMSISLSEIMSSASIAFSMTPGLTAAAARVIESFGNPEMKKTYVEKMYTGTWSGTMCLTESGAGSAIGDLKTKANPHDDHYLIEGEKIFISSGEHDLAENIIHLVLARIKNAPKGIKGISLFVVPKFLVSNEEGPLQANHVLCSGIEHKMGIKGSPTCTMVFGSSGPCRGWLLGEANQGIQYMFKMMNEARLGVGAQGLSAASSSYLEALGYATERIQGVDIAQLKNVDAPRVPIIEHPNIRRYLLSMKAMSEGMRALLYSTAMLSDCAENSEDEQERKDSKNIMELLTPVCKAYCSDQGFRMTEIGIQVLGGYGYTQEYPQEQYCRDVKIASIYEGTNGIQALDLLGRKVSGKGGVMFMTFLMRLNTFLEENENHETIGPYVAKLMGARDKLIQVVMGFQQAGENGEIYHSVLNANPFLEMLGHIVVGQHLCAMAGVADKKLKVILDKAGVEDKDDLDEVLSSNPDANFYDGKLHSMRFFIDSYLPQATAIADGILSNNMSPMQIIF